MKDTSSPVAKDAAAAEDFLAAFAALKTLCLQLRVPPAAPGRLAACGLLIINPPWKFEEAMREALPWIVAALGPGVDAAITSCRRPSVSSPTS